MIVYAPPSRVAAFTSSQSPINSSCLRIISDLILSISVYICNLRIWCGLLQEFMGDPGFQAYVEELQGVWDKLVEALPDSDESEGHQMNQTQSLDVSNAG
jgi:hypothetical protein